MTTILMTGFVLMIVGVLIFAYFLPYIIIAVMIGIPVYIIVNKYKELQQRKDMRMFGEYLDKRLKNDR